MEMREDVVDKCFKYNFTNNSQISTTLTARINAINILDRFWIKKI